jgi:hypothetical protein
LLIRRRRRDKYHQGKEKQLKKTAQHPRPRMRNVKELPEMHVSEVFSAFVVPVQSETSEDQKKIDDTDY